MIFLLGPRRTAAEARNLIIAAILLLLQFGCDQLPSTSTPSAPQRQDANPTAVTLQPAIHGGIIAVRLRDEITSVNPFTASRDLRKVTSLLFDGLMRLDAQLRPLPALAESWSASPDDLTWTFKLRTDVRWHDGTTLTADDIIFTYRVLLDGPTALGDLIGPAQSDLQQVVEEIAAPDPYTIRLKLRRRFAPLLYDFTLPILPRHLLQDIAPSDVLRASITVGTGPFRLLEQRGTGSLILEAFRNYYLGSPFLDRIAFLVASEDETAKALADGRLQLAEVGAQTAGTLKSNSTVDVLSYPDLDNYYIGFNLRPGHIFADKALRHAWANAIDKNALVEGTFDGQAEAVWSDVPSYSWAYEPALPHPERNLTRSRALLDAAGWQQVGSDGIRVKNGQRLTMELAVRQDALDRVNLARALAGQLREAGIEARVAPSDFGSTMAAARRPPFDFAALLMGWAFGGDPDDYYLFHSSQIPTNERPNGYNYVGFRNDEFDRLSLEARGTTDWTRRADLYRQTQHILADEQPYQFLWSERAYLVGSHRLRGIPSPPSPSIWSSINRWQLQRN